MRIDKLTSLFLGILIALIASPTVLADALTAEIFYTRFSGAPNVKKVTATYDGVGSFVLGIPIAIGTTTGADGIAGNPQNSDLLLVGGQGPRINTISKSTGTATIYPSPVSVFHLEVSDPTTVYGAGIPGSLAKHTINPDGSLTAGTAITLSGSNTTITQLISTPSGFYYTSSGAGGFGAFGTLTITGPTTATTTSLITGLPAAHGGVYDPFTGDIIVMGDGHVTQIDLSGTIVSDRAFSGVNFDQGTVDGKGHLFVASNTGHLLFVDYKASGLVGDLSNFSALPFLDSNLDDIAPLVGEGTTNQVIPSPSAAMIGLPLLALFGLTRRRRAA